MEIYVDIYLSCDKYSQIHTTRTQKHFIILLTDNLSLIRSIPCSDLICEYQEWLWGLFSSCIPDS